MEPEVHSLDENEDAILLRLAELTLINRGNQASFSSEEDLESYSSCSQKTTQDKRVQANEPAKHRAKDKAPDQLNQKTIANRGKPPAKIDPTDSTPAKKNRSPNKDIAKKSGSRKGWYFEKQKSFTDTCRIHALNAFFGYPKFNPSNFAQKCAKFDELSGMAKGTSQTYFFVDQNGKNIISWLVEEGSKFSTKLFHQSDEEILEFFDIAKVRRSRKKQTPGETNSQKEKSSFCGVVGYFEFSNEHVWYVGRDNDSWFILDSNTNGVRKQNKLPLDPSCGHILVFKNI